MMADGPQLVTTTCEAAVIGVANVNAGIKQIDPCSCSFDPAKGAYEEAAKHAA
jgi:hypothetical protein